MPATPLPLAMQYVCTNGWCASFACALQAHAAGAGGQLVELVDVTGKEPDELHVLLRLPDGRLLDAEGARSFAEVCADWNLKAETARLVERPVIVPSASPSAAIDALMRDIITAHGWTADDLPGVGSPQASDDLTAAAKQFRSYEHADVVPQAFFEEMLEDGRSPVWGLARLKRALDIHRRDESALFFEGGRGRGKYGLAYRDLTFVACHDSRRDYVVDLHVDGVPPVTGTQTDEDDGDSWELAVARFVAEAEVLLARYGLDDVAPEPEMAISPRL